MKKPYKLKWEKLEDDENIIRYLQCIRDFVKELRALKSKDVNDLLSLYNVKFVEGDEYPRVNFDFSD